MKIPFFSSSKKDDSKSGPGYQSPEKVVEMEWQEAAIRDSRFLTKRLLWFVLFGVVSITIFSLANPFQKPENLSRSVFSVLSLIALASAFIGVSLGFLFGLPKSNKDHHESDSRYALNNNLVEVSDWLTKIIVGLGLVEAGRIIRKIISFGEEVSNIVPGDEYKDATSIAAICVLVYFFILGFYTGYNYTRLVLSRLFRGADDDIMEMIIKREDPEGKRNFQELQKEKEANKQTINELVENFNEKNGVPDQFIETENSFGEHGSIDFLLSRQEFNELAEKVRLKFESGKKFNPKDPNKGQWHNPVEANNWKFSAKISAINKDNTLFRIQLEVSPKQGSMLRDNDVVLFALHPTFHRPFKVVHAKDNKATLDIIAYGAFTVGVYIKSSNEELELDLAQIPDAPKNFIAN